MRQLAWVDSLTYSFDVAVEWEVAWTMDYLHKWCIGYENSVT